MPYKDETKRKEFHAAYYQDHKEKALEYQKKFSGKNREVIDAYKRDAGCADCGNNDPRVLQFHHRDSSTKRFTIASKMHKLKPEKLLEEADLCDVVCSNCHLIRHSLDKEPFVRSPGGPKRS